MLVVKRTEAVEGQISVPGDKSISHRALLLASIARGKSVIENFLQGKDCLNTFFCLKELGVELDWKGDLIEVWGKGLSGLKEPRNVLDVGNSGTTTRLLAGILAGQKFLSVITGDESLRKRPMDRIIKPLKQMGAFITAREEGRLAPLVIKGENLRGIRYNLPVASAQVKSAILLAGLYARCKTLIKEDKKTRDHTEKMLKAFGADIKLHPDSIELSPSFLQGREVLIPGDFSSAAFFLAAGASVAGAYLEIKDVGLNPTRTGLIDALRKMGAEIEIDSQREESGEKIGRIKVRGKKLRGTTLDGAIIPRMIDEIPAFTVACACAEGKSIIKGAGELRFKETDRIRALSSEFKKLGVAVEELNDGMEIYGQNNLSGGEVDSFNDHRIAMALAVCALFTEDPVKIRNSSCIDVSFPGFSSQLKKMGLECQN